MDGVKYQTIHYYRNATKRYLEKTLRPRLDLGKREAYGQKLLIYPQISKPPQSLRIRDCPEICSEKYKNISDINGH